MRPRHTDTLSIFQTSDIFPVDFVVPKAWPTVFSRLATEVIVGTTNGGSKEQCSRDRVVIFKFFVATLGVFEFVDVRLVAKGRA